MAENLVRHKADLNHIDQDNQTLLHLAIRRGRLSYSYPLAIRASCVSR